MALITSITRERKTITIVLENGDRIKVPLFLFRQHPLEEQQELNVEEYDQWLMVRQYRNALDRAVGYLAARACSKKEIQDKLLRIGYRPCTVEMVLYKLEINHLLDDEDFAHQWAEARARKHLGPRRIAMELRQKGISSETLDETLASLSPEEQAASAEELVRRKLKSIKANEDPRKTASKITAMLIRRGYDWETAKGALQAVMHDIQEDESYDE